MSLYLALILGTIMGPFFLSFDKKVHFYTNWKALFPSLLIVGIIFLVWDEYFTQNEIWGFNSRYLSGIFIGSLPLEECLFFLVVPYACVFIYEVLKSYFPLVKPTKLSHFFAFSFTLAGLVFGIIFMENWYTSSACILAALITIGVYFVKKVVWYPRFVLAFLVAQIPFILVNGALTGSFTDEPVVWYSENHIMGPRIFTIPVEDVFYNYSMLLPIVTIYEYLKQKFKLG